MTSYLHRPLQRVTSLRRRVHVNAPAASYWLRRVVDEASAETGRVRRARPGCRGRSLQCAIALSNNGKPRRMHRVQLRGLLLPMFRGLCVLSVRANRELW